MDCTGDINTLMLMERMLDTERPDLVVFTGDNVDGLSSNDAYAVRLTGCIMMDRDDDMDLPVSHWIHLFVF